MRTPITTRRPWRMSLLRRRVVVRQPYVVPQPNILPQPQPVVVQKPVALEFGSFQHYDQLAERLDTLANQFCLDLHYNYQQNPGFQEAYRESYQLLQAARQMHASEHRGDREAIRRSGTSIDNLFHHVQGEVKNWSGAQRRQIGQFALPAKIEEMEALIHHLMFDIGVKPEHDGAEAAPPPSEQAPPPVPPVAAAPPPAPPANLLPPAP